jgi:amino acid transporter
VVLFVWLAARRVVAGAGWMALWSRSGLFQTRSILIGPLLAGAAIATFSYIGFDAISTLAEDTLHPERDIAFSTVLVCVAQGVFCVVIVFLAALVWPNYHSFPRVETAILDISRLIGGAWMVAVITLVLLVAGLACALTGQAGASRLLFGMARDGAISKRIFGYLDPKHSTPVRSIYAMGVITALGTVLIRFELAVELLNFGALVGFILVNLSVIRHYYSRQRLRSGWQFISNLILPSLGAFVCLYLWLSLSNAAKLVGFCWLGAGTIYLAVLTRGFRERPVSLHL